MKTRLLFVWLLSSACMVIAAQTEELEYRPFAEEGKFWETRICNSWDHEYHGRITGDTIINGETWMKVINNKAGTVRKAYYAAVRDEGEKVYAIAKGSSRPRLLYDFSLKEGDFIRCGVEGNAFGCLCAKEEPKDSLLGFPFEFCLKVERIDTVKLKDGLNRRRFTLSLWDTYRDFLIAKSIVWIEGLGSGSGPFSPWMAQSPKCPDKDRQVYITYWGNSNNTSPHIATSDDFYDLESSTAVTSPQQSSGNDTLYDLEGRELSKKPTQGIYIENGKKRAR